MENSSSKTVTAHVKIARKQDSIRVGILEKECAWKFEIASRSLREAERGGRDRQTDW